MGNAWYILPYILMNKEWIHTQSVFTIHASGAITNMFMVRTYSQVCWLNAIYWDSGNMKMALLALSLRRLFLYSPKRVRTKHIHQALEYFRIQTFANSSDLTRWKNAISLGIWYENDHIVSLSVTKKAISSFFWVLKVKNIHQAGWNTLE